MGSRTSLAVSALALGSLTAHGVAHAQADGPRRGGRVVRVARDTRRGFGEPRLCELMLATGTVSGSCIAQSVAVGDIVTVFRDHEHHSKLRISAVAQDPTLGCSSSQLIASATAPGVERNSKVWLVEAQWIDAAPTGLDTSQVPAVIDGGVDAPAAVQRTVDASPSGRATDLEYFAFDIDGDGEVDLAFDHFECDYRGKPRHHGHGRRGYYGAAAQCYDLWTSPNRGDALQLARTDVVPRC